MEIKNVLYIYLVVLESTKEQNVGEFVDVNLKSYTM
jgi:hypothetical protein